MKTILVIVEGRVQGVYFRDYTQKHALQLNLSGWVRNKRDGSVEAMLQGADSEVTSMLDWFWQGSPKSKVANVRPREARSEEHYTTFEIHY